MSRKINKPNLERSRDHKVASALNAFIAFSTHRSLQGGSVDAEKTRGLIKTIRTNLPGIGEFLDEGGAIQEGKVILAIRDRIGAAAVLEALGVQNTQTLVIKSQLSAAQRTLFPQEPNL